MESEVPIHCQWTRCDESAVKHLVFGVRVFDSQPDLHKSESSYTPEHLDLCLKHVELIGIQYIHVTEYDLGMCPEHPR